MTLTKHEILITTLSSDLPSEIVAKMHLIRFFLSREFQQNVTFLLSERGLMQANSAN